MRIESLFLILSGTLAHSAGTGTQRSGAHRNVLHWTPLKYMGPPTATLSTDDNKFHVYYRSPVQRDSEAPYKWEDTHTENFIHWEDGDVFAAPSSRPQASFESGVVYPNPVPAQSRPPGDTKYNVLLSERTSRDVRVVSRGSSDGLTSIPMDAAIKASWNVKNATAAEAFSLQDRNFIAYLLNNACDYVYFAFDDDTPATSYFSRWQPPLGGETGTCTDLNINTLDDVKWIIAITRIPASRTTPQTQYWAGDLIYLSKKQDFDFVFDPSYLHGDDFFMDDGTDAAHFRLGRIGDKLKAVGYISGGPTTLYPEGLYNSLTLVRDLTWNGALQQKLPDMTKNSIHTITVEQKFPITADACLPLLTGKLVSGEGGWLFSLSLVEGDAPSGWEIQFRTGGWTDKGAQYITVAYDGNSLTIDRAQSKKIGVKDKAQKMLKSTRLNPVTIVLDKAALEVYVNCKDAPTTVMTMSYWTDTPIADVCILAEGNPGKLLASSAIHQLPSIWSPGQRSTPSPISPKLSTANTTWASNTHGAGDSATDAAGSVTTHGEGSSPMRARVSVPLIGLIVLAVAI